MNNKNFVINNGSDWKQAEDILKELKDFSPMGLDKIEIMPLNEIQLIRKQVGISFTNKNYITLYFCITSFVNPYLREK